MVAALTLWTHALAALLFGGLAFWAIKPEAHGVPRRTLAAALALTALWALAVAGIGSDEMVTRVAETARTLGWLCFMRAVQRADPQRRPPLALGSVYGVVALVALSALAVHLAAQGAATPASRQGAELAVNLLRMLVAVAALVLVQALHAAARPQAGLRWAVIALAAMWAADFAVFTTAYLSGRMLAEPLAVRGAVLVLAGLAFATGLHRKGRWEVQVSRTVAYQSLSLVAIGAYFALLALATSALATIGGSYARLLQTAFVFGSTAAILTLVSNSWLRGWTKVKLAKHLFRHRYDYRAEWMRFTDTLGAPDAGTPLEARIVKAVADLTVSPGGLLLVPDGGGLGVGARWNWPETALPAAADQALAAHLEATTRIIEIDAIRADPAAPDAAAVPRWMIDTPDAWVLVPLPHFGALAGAILLARPPADRTLDWEDLDLLRVAGRQAASYLGEARAQAALAEAQRFDEFNRRFAFILHDIKNLVSQLTLTARNAERHADNPAFRADMVATLQNSAERMNALLARLSQHHRGRSEAAQPVALRPLAERIAAARTGQHAVTVEGAPDPIALAEPQALEQLLGHLVQNAVEASAPDAPVRILLHDDGRAVRVDVVDRGCGMSPAFIRDQLFKPFVSSKPGEFGIGAFEARQLATAMGATIAVNSREGQGTRFRVALRPVRAISEERAA